MGVGVGLGLGVGGRGRGRGRVRVRVGGRGRVRSVAAWSNAPSASSFSAVAKTTEASPPTASALALSVIELTTEARA